MNLYSIVKNKYDQGLSVARILNETITDTSFSIDEVKLMLYKRFDVPFEKMNYTLSEIRDKQGLFRQELIDKYGCCVISNLKPYECDLNNGILLNKCLHGLFDKHIWSIDNNKTIVVKDDYDDASIKKYEGNVVQLDDDVMKYMKKHYEIFINCNN